MIFARKMITNHVLLISALFGLCVCDNLPLTLWKFEYTYEFPICAKNSYTESDAKKQPTILHLCPNEEITVGKFGDVAKSCLFKTFNNDEHCAKKVDPIIVAADGTSSCGFENRGTLYKFGYKLCRKHDWNNNGQDEVKTIGFKTMYTFCFDHNAKKVLYVKHGIISPTLINHEELREERITPQEQIEGINFGLDYLDSNATSLRKPLQEMVNEINTYVTNQQNGEEKEKLAFLADPADMAFRVWRYPFFRYVNAVLINEDLVEPWKKMNDDIRKLAKEKLGEIKIITGTGVITTNEKGSYTLSPANDVSAPVVWKIVYTEHEYFAVAIIVHNVKSDEDIKKLCQPNSCQQIGLQGVIPENFDNFFECCDPSQIIQKFNLPSAYALTSVPEYQSEFHLKAQKCNAEKYLVGTKKEFPFVRIWNFMTPDVIQNYLSGKSMGLFKHFCPDVSELQQFVSKTYENGEEYNSCLYENIGLDYNCDNAVRPFIRYSEKSSCGNTEGLAVYLIQYNECVASKMNKNELLIKPTNMYYICYSNTSNKVQYIDYKFMSTELLENDKFMEKNTFVSKYETFNSGLGALTNGIRNIQNIEESLKKDIRDVKNNRLVLQMLVHPENMAFAAWKKATYHVLNTQPMWSHLTYVWNHINEYIRNAAIRRQMDLHIMVGVSDVARETIDEKFSSIWWIIVEWNLEGVAILMHNDPADRKSQQICEEADKKPCDVYLEEGIIPKTVPEDSVYCCNGSVIANRNGFSGFMGTLNLKSYDEDYGDYESW